MVLIKFGDISILHTGDWKFDSNPLVGDVTNEEKFKQIGRDGVDYLICDSTNSWEERATESEGLAKENLDILVRNNKGKRIIVSCFSSNVARISGLIDIAEKYNRKICFLGKSMLRIINASYKTGYLTPRKNIITPEQVSQHKPGEIMIVCTGSQGEKGSVLQRVSHDAHTQIKFHRGDVVVFSSRVIPGNEIEITAIKNNFVKRGIEIIDTSYHSTIHVSGHPSRPEVKRLLELTQPANVIPVHGDALHLLGIKNLCFANGYKNVLIPHNGALIALKTIKDNQLVNHPEIVESIKVGEDGLDGKQIISLESKLLQTRKNLSENGCIFITFKPNEKPLISNCGVLPSKIINNNYYLNHIDKILKKHLINNEERTIRFTANQISGFIYENYGKSPVVIIHT
jgi:ribonuclease J